MKRLLSISFLLLSPFLLKAQHENHYQELDPIEQEAFKVSFSDQHSQKSFMYIKLEIENKTRDYLMFEPDQVSFTIEGESYHVEEETVFIPPKESETQKFKVRGDRNFHVDSLTLEFGGLSRVPKDAEVQKGDPFKLPASKNSFKVGDGTFECTLDGDVKKETDVTKAAFEWTYYGEGVGLVDHSKVSVKTEEGKEFANKKKKGVFGKVAGKKNTKTLLDGESCSVKTQFEIPAKVVDMQFAPLFIHWNDAFKEATPEDLGSFERALKLDRAKTEGMN